MARRPERTNHDWQTPEHAQFTWEQVIVEVLMDIRAELQRQNGVLLSEAFASIQRDLRTLATYSPPRPPAKPKKRKR